MVDARTPIVVGPTAVGKTAVAMALAALLPVEVISADSRQVYRGLDIATAKPTADERKQLRHHLIDRVDPGERYSAGRFAIDAAAAVRELREAGKLPLVVGGTGLYVKALTEGLFAEPPLDRPRRDDVTAATATMDQPTLVRWAHRLDPQFNGGGGRHRASRVIQMALLTGKPLSWWQRAGELSGSVQPWFVRLTAPRAVLHQRINARAEAMVREGLLDEVAAVIARGAPSSGAGMDGIGVREAVAVLEGRLPRGQLASTIATATRQYAKRQETWFRHQLAGPVLTLDTVPSPDQLAATIAAAWEQSTS